MSRSDESPRICIVTNGSVEADDAASRLRLRYGDYAMEAANVVVALGGDGLMLQTLHRVMRRVCPFMV
jgi:NAD+ kinase